MTETDFDRAADALAARIEILLKDNYALTRLLDGERDENARLSAAAGRAEGEAAALRDALGPADAMGERFDALAHRLDGLAEQVGRLGAALHQGRPGGGLPAAAAGPEARNEAAEQLHAVLTSRSWRMTRPIRVLGRIARRLRG